MPEFHIDTDGIRALAKDVWLLPGKGYVCLAATLTNGTGASCKPIRQASRDGISRGSPTMLVIAVPDGVKAVKARVNGQRPWRAYPIENGLVRLPDMRYRWRRVR
jgi:hypothetical protein